MPGIVLFTGPLPPAGELFCTICAADWKSRELTRLKPRIIELQQGSGGTLEIRSGPIPAAVAFGIFEPLRTDPMGGQPRMPFPVPLCWSHLLAISMQETALLPADASMMPGSGPGGAVMLNQRGR